MNEQPAKADMAALFPKMFAVGTGIASQSSLFIIIATSRMRCAARGEEGTKWQSFEQVAKKERRKAEVMSTHQFQRNVQSTELAFHHIKPKGRMRAREGPKCISTTTKKKSN